MDFDLGTILSAVSFIFANKLILGSVVGVFVGWNLPQPAFAKKVQDLVVKYVSLAWNKLKSKSE